MTRLLRILQRLPISMQLAVIISCAALPVMGEIVRTGFQDRSEATETARKDLSNLLDSLVYQQQALVASTQQLAVICSQLPAIKSGASGSLQTLLANVLKQNNQYLNIVVTDRDGMVVASALPVSTSFSVSTMRCFKNARENGVFSSGDYAVEQASGNPTVCFGYPLKNDHDDFTGLILISLNLDELNAPVDETKYHFQVRFALVDRNGTIVRRYHEPDSSSKPDRAVIFNRMKSGPATGEFTADTPTWGVRLFQYRQLYLPGEREPYLYLRASVPVAVITEKANSELLRNILAMLIFVAASIGLTWVLASNLIVKRIKMLERASRQLAAGNLDIRISELVLEGELGGLSSSFNTMAAELQAREKSLRENGRFLAALINATQESSILITVGGTIVVANQVFVQRFGSIVGRNFYDLLPPETAQFRREKLDEAARRGQPVFFEDSRAGIDFQHSVYPVINEQGITRHLAVYSLDITERKRAEQELITSRTALQMLNHNLEAAREEERQHIAREIHDVLGQSLTAQKLDVIWLSQQCAASAPEVRERLSEMQALADSLIQTVQAITAELAPPLLENLGLAAAIGWHAQEFERRTGIECHLMLDEGADQQLDKQEEMTCFRICQEAITNATRHAGATEVSISLCLTATSLILEVADNGRGISSQEINSPQSLGLTGMRERARICGATLYIQGAPNRGTIVMMDLPRREWKGDCRA